MEFRLCANSVRSCKRKKAQQWKKDKPLEKCWLDEPFCEHMVKHAWNSIGQYCEEKIKATGNAPLMMNNELGSLRKDI